MHTPSMALPRSKCKRTISLLILSKRNTRKRVLNAIQIHLVNWKDNTRARTHARTHTRANTHAYAHTHTYVYCMRFEDLDIHRRSEDPLLIWTLHRRLFQYILFMNGNFQCWKLYIVSIFGFYEIAIYLFVNVFEGNEDPLNLSALRGQC